eukprot:Lithocolla_globosa_v1_NODE_1135_length_2844_cov_18.474364.p2 type:complete len:423 gc:universal NODE_1135_length_2844_cov_18.474364:1554-2822(+)
MSSKEEILAWQEGCTLFDSGDHGKAYQVFETVASVIGAKIMFNQGLCQGQQRRYNEAIQALTNAIRADKYFAAAYFMRGVYQHHLNDNQKATQDFTNTIQYLRGNTMIDYQQLGMDYKLHACEVYYNRAFVGSKLGRSDPSYQDLIQAQQLKSEPKHDAIDTALRTQRFDELFSLPPKTLYRPPEQKVKNVDKVDYLGSSRVVAAVDENDKQTGFKDAAIRRQQKEQEKSYAQSQQPAYGGGGGGGGIARPQQSWRAPPARPGPATPPAAAQTPSPAPPMAPVAQRPAPAFGNRAPPSVPGGGYGGQPTPPGGGYGGPPQQQQTNFATPVVPPQQGVGGGGGGGSGTKIKVKCHYKDTRIVMMDDNVMFRDFSTKLSEKFDGAKLRFKYKDEDGDMVLISDDEDLSLAFTFTNQNKLEITAI